MADEHRAIVGAFEKAHAVPEGIDRTAIVRAVRELYARGQDEWPGVDLGVEAYARHVAGSIGPLTHESLAALTALDGAGLYIVCACLGGSDAAVVAFEKKFGAVLERAATKVTRDRSSAGDVVQRLRERLIVGAADSPPKLATYSGAGGLGGWLRVSVTREAISATRVKKSDKNAGTLDDQSLVSADADPELRHLRSRYAPEFAAAFSGAMASLTSEERNLLRHHFLDRLTIDEIGAIYRIHRVTAARRVNRARALLVERTKEMMQERLSCTDTELLSVLRVIQSEANLSIRRVLGPSTGDSEDESDARSAGEPEGRKKR